MNREKEESFKPKPSDYYTLLIYTCIQKVANQLHRLIWSCFCSSFSIISRTSIVCLW